MKNITYCCSKCPETYKAWVSVKSNDKIYTYCCYEAYQAYPSILPTKAVFKSTGNETIITPIVNRYNDNSFKFKQCKDKSFKKGVLLNSVFHFQLIHSLK